MTLEGSLDAFSLPDIFQLLSFTKKTGALHITGPATAGVVHFATGSVTGASSDTGRHSLGRRLVGAGLYDDQTLAAAVAKVSEDPGTGFGRALHDAGADDGVLHEQVLEQTTDAVFDLLRWTRGDFNFRVDEPNPDDLGVSVPVEEIIAEARRRLETWETLTRTVPSPDSVVSVALTPPSEETALTPDEWTLLALVDGRRSVAELVRLSGRGEFATVRTLVSLVDRSLVVVRAAADEASDGISALLRRQSQLSALEGRPEPVHQAEPEPEPVAQQEPEPVQETKAPPQRQTAPPQRLATVPDVVPQRPEPIRGRQPEFAEERRPAAAVRPTTQTAGNAAVATDATPGALIERDPSVNKSLLLRLIAGVRGL